MARSSAQGASGKMTFFCKGKAIFANAPSANKALKASNRRSNVKLQAYRCTVCGNWHIGQALGKVSPDAHRRKIARKAGGVN